HRRELHELVERPLELILHRTLDFERPRCEIDLRRTMRVEHRPLLRPRLSWRDAFIAPRVRTDDDVRIVNRFRRTRICGLVLRIAKQIVEKSHGFVLCTLCLVLSSLYF